MRAHGRVWSASVPTTQVESKKMDLSEHCSSSLHGLILAGQRVFLSGLCSQVLTSVRRVRIFDHCVVMAGALAYAITELSKIAVGLRTTVDGLFLNFLCGHSASRNTSDVPRLMFQSRFGVPPTVEGSRVGGNVW